MPYILFAIWLIVGGVTREHTVCMKSSEAHAQLSVVFGRDYLLLDENYVL